MCTGAAMLSSANFTAYDSLSWLPLIILLEEDVNYFLLRVRFNFQPPTQSQLTCIVLVYWCFSQQDSYLPFNTSRVCKHHHSIKTEGFLIIYGLWQSPGTISNLPFWVSLVEQTRVEIVKLSLELTERPPPPVTLLELRLRPPDDLWVSPWWCRVEGRDK